MLKTASGRESKIMVDAMIGFYKVIGLIIFLSNVGVNLIASPNDKISFEDSVFNSFPKNERIKKLLFLPISNFENKSQLDAANELLHTHNLGGVIVRNGDVKNLKQWINNIKQKKNSPPLFVFSFSELLTLPLKDVSNLLNENQIELLSSDSTIEAFGQTVGELVKSIGFDMIVLDPSHVDSTMQFVSKSKRWVKHYLTGINEAGVPVIFGNIFPTPRTSYQFLYDEIANKKLISGFISDQIFNDDYQSFLKRKYSKKTKYDGVILKHVKYREGGSVRFDALNDLLILPHDIDSALSMVDYFSVGKKLRNRLLKKKLKKYIRIQKRIITHKKSSLSFDEANKKFLKVTNEILKGSIVCLKNEGEILPFKHLDQAHFATITANSDKDRTFRNYLDKYTRFAHFDLQDVLNDPVKSLSSLSHFDNIVVKFDGQENYSTGLFEVLKILQLHAKITVCYIGKKEGLTPWSGFNALIWTPQNNSLYAKAVPQALFGAFGITGILPYHDLANYSFSNPFMVRGNKRLSYSHPELLDVSSNILNKIDEVVHGAIKSQAMPGCQVMMIKNGSVVYQKTFGYFTYDSLLKIEPQSIYDIASITKVVGTVPAIMFLEEKGKLSSTDLVGDHLSSFANTDKANISIGNLLKHQSGLKSHLPFWKNATLKNWGDFRYKLSKRRRRPYKGKSVKINWNDSIQYWIARSEYNSLQLPDGSYDYLYSDLGFMVLKNIAEAKLNQPMDVFLSQNIFKPLGMTTTFYEPLCSFPIDQIVPTEVDNYFRKDTIWGRVNDQNAALDVGADGQAGLFSNAADLGKYLQMLLYGGTYGGLKYFERTTIEKYSTKDPSSKRRALGWDKPDRKVGNASRYASELSYGHTGFTGTMVWIDPKYDFIYVFLSNRTYPDAKNNKLSETNIRTRIHDIMYESFLNDNVD